MAVQSSDNRPGTRKYNWLDPILNILTPRHSHLFHRYETVRIAVDFGAAACFVTGSMLFLSASNTLLAARLFLIGSILFALKPSIDMVRAFHLSKIHFGGGRKNIRIIEPGAEQ